MKRGMGEDQIEKAKSSTKKILDALEDGEWHRYKDLQKQTGVSTATLSKHLKKLEKGIVEKKRDLESGKYPYPVYYRLKQGIFPKLPRARAHPIFRKLKQPRCYIHLLNILEGIVLTGLLKEYLQNPSQNEEMFTQATEFNIISMYRGFIENIKLWMKELAEKGENVEQILTESQTRFLEDYHFLIKEIGKTDVISFFSPFIENVERQAGALFAKAEVEGDKP